MVLTRFKTFRLQSSNGINSLESSKHSIISSPVVPAVIFAKSARFFK